MPKVRPRYFSSCYIDIISLTLSLCQPNYMICYFSLQTDMDNASFLASLAPDLRQEILLTADDAFITSLPPTLIAEANVLRERVAADRAKTAPSWLAYL